MNSAIIKLFLYGDNEWVLLTRAPTSTRLHLSQVIGKSPKFWPKNSKMPILPEHWHIWYLKDADCYSDISFLNFQV